MRKFENSAQYSGRRVDGVDDGVEDGEVGVYGVAEGVGRRCRRRVMKKYSVLVQPRRSAGGRSNVDRAQLTRVDETATSDTRRQLMPHSAAEPRRLRASSSVHCTAERKRIKSTFSLRGRQPYPA